MNFLDIQIAIEKIRYKPGSSIALLPMSERISNVQAGTTKLVIKLTLVDPEDPQKIKVQIHYKELPPPHHIQDRFDLLRLIRNALRECEAYELDQWLSIEGQYPFKKPRIGRGASSPQIGAVSGKSDRND